MGWTRLQVTHTQGNTLKRDDRAALKGQYVNGAWERGEKDNRRRKTSFGILSSQAIRDTHRVNHPHFSPPIHFLHFVKKHFWPKLSMSGLRKILLHWKTAAHRSGPFCARRDDAFCAYDIPNKQKMTIRNYLKKKKPD